MKGCLPVMRGRAAVVLGVVMAVGLVSEAGYAETLSGNESGAVKLVATIKDNPAFTQVVWKLFRLDVPGSEPVRVIPRHTAIVHDLQPGDYRAEALLKSTKRSRLFSLEPESVKEIVLSMDE